MGLKAAPVVRATPVIPAAADRSSGLTTAIVYDCRVGTSIWLILNRTSKTAIAQRGVGIIGTSSSSTLEGKCVKTIVLTRPKRNANREAARADSPANTLAQKKITPMAAGSIPNRRLNQ